MIEEIWKPVVGYEGYYEASNLWLIRNLKGKILWWNSNWYRCVDLLRKADYIHRVIAKTFIQNPENKEEVNHINWIKSDNRVENLEWVTPKENVEHAWRIWLIKNNFKLINANRWKFWKYHHSSKKVIQYTLSWEFIRDWDCMTDVQRCIYIQRATISLCCTWKLKSAWWFIWKYK